MESPPRRKALHHRAPDWVKAGTPYFVTICCAQRKTNSLADAHTFTTITSSLEHYISSSKLWAHLLVAMPDHLHALLAFPAETGMSKILRDWKRFTAKKAGINWQDGFFDHRLRNDKSFAEKAHYMRMNPVRAGLVSSPDEWPYVWSTIGADNK